MAKVINIVLGFVKKYYFFVILAILFVSYGQILSMLPWQDDNALFFKLAHIYEPAGFLGNGFWGEGAYKYTATFYYPIYLIFGYQPIYYFLLNFILYGLSTFVVYKTVTKLFDKNSGMIAGFLYACGFIGSDSYIRLFNSHITSISIILVCLFLNFYYNYSKAKKISWYLLSFAIFFIAAEFARARTHYLVALPFLFELVFLIFKKPIVKSITYSAIRLLPFIAVFYRYVIAEDFRSQEAGNFIISLIDGGFYKLFGFLSSFSNLILPNWLIMLLSPSSGGQAAKNYLSDSIFYFVIIGLVVFVSLIYLFFKYKKTRLYIILFVTFSIIWKYVSSVIFLTPFLVVSSDQILLAFMGGELLFLGGIGFLLTNKKHKGLYFLLFSAILINLLSYSAYNPTQVYEKINRYLSHSFLYLVIFGSFIYFIAKDKTRKVIFIVLILWGINNLTEGYLYQRSILLNRTEPVRAFYKEFQRMVIDVKKGDIIYFDVADNARSRFADAFSVAQMPNTTAIAWRYGIDRDDFKMFEEPQDLFNELETNPLNDRRIRTFFYSKDGLFDTTNDFLNYFNKKLTLDFKTADKSSGFNSNTSETGTYIGKSEVELSDNISIPSLVPVKLKVSLIARPLDIRGLKLPIHYGLESSPNALTSDNSLMNLAFDYSRFRKQFRNSHVTTSSTWQGRVAKNVLDGDENSSWQADRLLWLKDEQYLIVKMDSPQSFNRLTFINSFSDNSPLEFEMFYSDNLTDWKSLGFYKSTKRLANGEMVITNFEAKSFRYFKIKFNKILNGDSPAISELLLVPTRFSSMDVKEANQYLNNPFAIIPNLDIYNDLLSETFLTGKVDVQWMNDKKFGWQKDANTNLDVVFDGRERSYEITLPAGGTEINRLKFLSTNFPGSLTVTRIKAIY